MKPGLGIVLSSIGEYILSFHTCACSTDAGGLATQSFHDVLATYFSFLATKAILATQFYYPCKVVFYFALFLAF